MADAAAGAGQKQRTPRQVRGRHRRFFQSPSCPALCRASTSSLVSQQSKTWMAGTSPAMTVCGLRIEPHLAPGLAGGVATEFDAVVQAERAVVPELEAQRIDPPATPASRPRHLADHVFGRYLCNRLLEGKAALQRLRLLAGPGADLGLLRPRREIRVGLGLGHRRHSAADANLPAQRF